MAQQQQQATFAAGCFWSVELAFQRVPGVTKTAVGYTGGKTVNPTYSEVSSGTTGHTEAVQLEYDPAEVSYKQLLDVFWKKHDPTQVNRQVRLRYYPVCIAQHVFNLLLFDVLPSPSMLHSLLLSRCCCSCMCLQLGFLLLLLPS
jgi:hypothetical protein